MRRSAQAATLSQPWLSWPGALPLCACDRVLQVGVTLRDLFQLFGWGGGPDDRLHSTPVATGRARQSKHREQQSDCGEPDLPENPKSLRQPKRDAEPRRRVGADTVTLPENIE